MSARQCSYSNCSNVLAKSTRGTLCRKCFINKDKQDNTVSEEILNDYDANAVEDPVDLQRVVGDLVVSDLVSIIKQEVMPIVTAVKGIDTRLKAIELKIAKIEEEHNESLTKVDTIDKEVESLKRVILEQQKHMEIMKKKDTANNIVVNGIPNDPLVINDIEITDDNGKLQEIFRHIECVDKLSNDHKIIILPGRDDATTHSLKVQFTNNEDVKHIINNAKRLKSFEAAKIFINYDEPYYSRKENYRLRKKKSDLQKDHAGDEIKISRGKLYHNNMVVDRFNLSNQIF